MDKVLTRKMFKDRYFKSLKPVVKHFNTGGLGSLTSREKLSMPQLWRDHYCKLKDLE